MNKTQNSKMSMNYATQIVCERQIELINSLPAFKEAFQTFCVLLSRIKELFRLQDTTTTGFTQAKLNLKIAMVESAVQIAKGICFYAENTDDLPLMRKAHLTYSSIRFRDFEILQRCTTIKTLTEERIIPLADYGITESILDNFRVKVSAFEDAIVKPREIRALKKACTADLKALFKEVDRILKFKMDPMVIFLKSSHPQFYQDYFNARMIIDAGTRRTKSANPADLPASTLSEASEPSA